jgi:SAM-dependent methyltransferase
MKRVAPNSDWSDETRFVYEHDRVEWWERAPMPHRYHVYHAYINMLLRAIDKLRPLKALNVGCAQATLDLLLAERGVDMTCLEIRSGFLEYAKLRHERGIVHWVLGNFFEVQLENGPFDLVMSHHAIEHIVEPQEFVRRMASYARPGGHVLITTPNHSYIRNRLPNFMEIGDLSRYPGFANSCDAPDHIFAFARDELCSLGTNVGLQVEQHFFYESFLLAGHMKLWYLHKALPDWAVRFLEPLASLPIVGNTLFANQGVLFAKPK